MKTLRIKQLHYLEKVSSLPEPKCLAAHGCRKLQLSNDDRHENIKLAWVLAKE
jgi:hypothetical protein